jgi:hypothetical protein
VTYITTQNMRTNRLLSGPPRSIAYQLTHATPEYRPDVRQRAGTVDLSGSPDLGALPAWLSNAIQGALKGSSVSLGTSAGTKTFDLSDPKQVQQILALVQSGKSTGLNVKFNSPGSAPGPNTGIFANASPLLIGAGVLLALKLLL